MSDLKINGIEYNGITKVQLPLKDESGYAIYSEGESNGGGGNSSQIGSMTYPMSIEAMFYALENGTGATGTIMYETALPNTETLLFDTGLDEVHGLMFLAEGFPQVFNESSATQTTGLSIIAYENGTLKTIVGATRNGKAGIIYGSLSDAPIQPLSKGTIRIDGGKVYCTADYNQNANYTPFEPNIKYRWVAW